MKHLIAFLFVLFVLLLFGPATPKLNANCEDCDSR